MLYWVLQFEKKKKNEQTIDDFVTTVAKYLFNIKYKKTKKAIETFLVYNLRKDEIVRFVQVCRGRPSRFEIERNAVVFARS